MAPARVGAVSNKGHPREVGRLDVLASHSRVAVVVDFHHGAAQQLQLLWLPAAALRCENGGASGQ